VGDGELSIASCAMKRLIVTAPLVVLLTFSGAITASASTLSNELLSHKQLPTWSPYGVAASRLARCPESSFQVTRSSTEARVFLAQRKSETLFAEKLVTSSNPQAAYATAIAKTAKCPAATTINGNATFQQIKPLNLGRFSVTVRAFSLYAVVGGAAVTGCVAYARKGSVVLEIAELSMGSINERAFKSEVTLALAKIRA
jgi:hypothetical protein